MKIDMFIRDFLTEYISYREYYDDVVDLLDATIDTLVSSNTIEENKIIINDYCGDIYDAIILHNQYFPGEDINKSKELFHERLAFIAMFVKIYPQIFNYMNSYEWNEKIFIKEFSLEVFTKNADNNEITDMLDATISEYVSMNTYNLNKDIILRYYADIETAIRVYYDVIGILHYTTLEVIYSQLAFMCIFINIYPKIVS